MIAGVVLAAGRSSRMGSAKALLTIGGETFLSWAVRGLRAGGCDPVLVVRGPGDDGEHRQVGEEALRLKATVLINPVAEAEQIESLRIAIEALPSGVKGIIATPVDSPGVKGEVVAALIEAGDAGASIAVPTIRGRRGHPTFFGEVALRELLSDDLPEGARSVMRRHQHEVVEVPVATDDILLDIDTPADYRRLRESAE